MFPGVDYKRLEQVAMRGDTSPRAVGIRLAASLRAVGLTQAALGKIVGRSQAAIGNAIAGKNYPALETLEALFKIHQIDFNFTVAGETRQLPPELQMKLLVALDAEHAARAKKTD